LPGKEHQILNKLLVRSRCSGILAIFQSPFDIRHLKREKQHIHISMAKYNLNPGARDSLRFMKSVAIKTGELGEMFNSKSIQNVLKYKFIKVRRFGYFMGILYCGYLFFVTLAPYTEAIIFWFTF
jgi:hypothetical protein